MTTALAIVCTLKPSPAASSSDAIARQVLDALAGHGVSGSVTRAVDHRIVAGVERDMGGGDEWPGILERVRAADVLLIATPTWLGHMASETQRELERLNAELSETDDRVPEPVARTTATAARNAAHLAAVLGEARYPAYT